MVILRPVLFPGLLGIHKSELDSSDSAVSFPLRSREEFSV